MQLNVSLKVDASKTTRNKHDSNPYDLKRGSHHTILLKSFRIVFSDCTNMMILSHYGISVIINVRLYDSQDKLKTRRKIIRSFTLWTHTRPVTVNTLITRGTDLLAIMKSIWTAAILVYLRRIVYAALHTHMKTAAQPVFI